MFRWWMTALVCSLIFLVPSNLFLAFPTGSEFVTGLRVDYLIPKLYLSDLVGVAILASYFIWKHQQITQRLKLRIKNTDHRVMLVAAIVCLTLFALRQLFTQIPIMSIISLSRLLLGSLLMLVLLQLRTVLKKSFLLWSLITTLLFQTAISLYQWCTQTSAGGYFLLGETNLNHPLGLAKTIWYGQEKILPYGTTAHPNILGGVLAVFTVALLYYVLSKPNKRMTRVISTIAVLGGVGIIVLTQSISALLALLIGASIVVLQKRSLQHNGTLLYVKATKFWLVMLLFSVLSIFYFVALSTVNQNTPSIVRRFRLNAAAIELINQQPLFGTGLANFTNSLDHSVSHEKVIVPFLQPAHNIAVLFLSEVGVLGMLACWGLVYLVRQILVKNDQLGWFASRLLLVYSMILPIAVLDHYLITLQSGQLLLIVMPLLFMKFQVAETV